MTTPRPVAVLALLGALLLAVTFQVARNGRTAASSGPEPAGVATKAKTPPATRVDRPVKEKRPDRGRAPTRGRRRERRSRVSDFDAVRRAIARRRVVLLFFYQPDSADDAATASAVGEVGEMPGVAAFSVPVTRVARYRDVIAPVGVSQAPSVVIVDRARRARLLEGFVDADTLRQVVADAR